MGSGDGEHAADIGIAINNNQFPGQRFKSPVLVDSAWNAVFFRRLI